MRKNKIELPVKKTGMDGLIATKEKQLRMYEGQLKRLTDTYKEDAGKLRSKIVDIQSIIKALKKGNNAKV